MFFRNKFYKNLCEDFGPENKVGYYPEFLTDILLEKYPNEPECLYFEQAIDEEDLESFFCGVCQILNIDTEEEDEKEKEEIDKIDKEKLKKQIEEEKKEKEKEREQEREIQAQKVLKNIVGMVCDFRFPVVFNSRAAFVF